MSMLEGEEGVRADDDYAKGETYIPGSCFLPDGCVCAWYGYGCFRPSGSGFDLHSTVVPPLFWLREGRELSQAMPFSSRHARLLEIALNKAGQPSHVSYLAAGLSGSGNNHTCVLMTLHCSFDDSGGGSVQSTQPPTCRLVDQMGLRFRLRTAVRSFKASPEMIFAS